MVGNLNLDCPVEPVLFRHLVMPFWIYSLLHSYPYLRAIKSCFRFSAAAGIEINPKFDASSTDDQFLGKTRAGRTPRENELNSASGEYSGSYMAT